MVTSLNTTVPARDYISAQMAHYLRKTISPATTPTTTVVVVGTIPANAIVLSSSGVYVTTDLNGTTNVLQIGYAADTLGSADPDAYATNLALATTTGGFVAVDEVTTSTARPRAVDTVITATWTGTATTGAFDVVIGYIPNR